MLSASKTLLILSSVGTIVASIEAVSVTASSFVLQDSVTIPSIFQTVGPVPNDWIIDFRVSLTSTNIAGLEKLLYEVSTPGSSDYGQYLSSDEVCLLR